MFEPIIEERSAVISIITKGEFGGKVARGLDLEGLEISNLKFEALETLPHNDLVFVIADEISAEEWVKIRKATPDPIVAVGCAIPEETEFDSCAILETSVESCHQTLQAIIGAISREGLVNIDVADVKRVLTLYGKQGTAAYAQSMLAAEAAESTLKQLVDKGASLAQVKGALINIIAGEELNPLDVNVITQTFVEKLNDEAMIVFGSTLDMNKSGKELDLSVIVSY